MNTGISMLFMAVDMGGGVFSILSLAFKEKFDGLAASTYICVLVSTKSVDVPHIG